MSDIIEYRFVPDGTNFRIVSTARIGPPGPKGLAGEDGERGTSAFPGTEITDPVIDADGNVSFTWVTHWGINSEGDGYYATNPDDVPEAERAWWDPRDDTLHLGRPGT